MTKETSRTLSQVFLASSILTILFICGNCCSNSQRGSWGPEEFYDKGGGQVGYGAKYYSSRDDNSMPVALFGGILFVAFSIASSVFSERAKKLPSEIDYAPKPHTKSTLPEADVENSETLPGRRDLKDEAQ